MWNKMTEMHTSGQWDPVLGEFRGRDMQVLKCSGLWNIRYKL